MSTLTVDTVESLLKHLVGHTSFAALTPYVGLFTTNPTQSSSGVEVSTSSTGYARVSIGGAANWVYDSGTYAIKNANFITFASATANWGTIVGVGLFKTSSGNDLIWYTSLVNPLFVQTGMQITLASKTLVLEFIPPSIFNETFEANVAGNYELTVNNTGLSISREVDSQFGYKSVGSLKISVDSNSMTASDVENSAYLNTSINVLSDKSYTLYSSAFTTNSKIIPKVTMTFFDNSGSVISEHREDVQVNTIATNTWQPRSLTITSPATAKTIKVGVVVQVKETAQTGTVWFDDLRLIPSY